MSTIIFTLCSNNYLAHAKTLAESVAVFQPDAHVVIGLVDKKHPSIDYDFFKPAEIIVYDEIGCDFFEEMILAYNVIEFNTAVKPYYFEFLLNKYGNGSRVIYLDPDIALFSNMQFLSTLLDKHDIVLTPNLTKESETVTKGELASLRHGMYNLGFIGVKHSSEAFRFMTWWQRRLRKHCVINKPYGLFVDQKWVDIAPLFFRDIYVMQHQGYNMAWWNLNERLLLKENAKYFVNETSQELVFFHFSGYKPGSAYYTGRQEDPDYSFTAHPELYDIFHDYSNALNKNGLATYAPLAPLLKFAPIKTGKPASLGKKIRSTVKAMIRKKLNMQQGKAAI